MTITVAEIREIYALRVSETSLKDGSFRIGNVENHSLLQRGVEISTLSYECLVTALIESLNASLFPSIIVIGNRDQNYLWAWCAQLIITSRTEKFGYPGDDLKNQLEHAVIAANATCSRHDRTTTPHYHQLLLDNSHKIFPYLTFPLLESVLRKVNSDYIDPSGLVLRDFEASNRYRADGHKRCSRVEDLLGLYYQRQSDDLKKTIDDCLRCVQSQNNKHAFKQISDWRNGLMHGNESINYAGCAILTLCCIILLNYAKDEFESMQEDGHLIIQQSMLTSYRPHWSFYPPI